MNLLDDTVKGPINGFPLLLVPPAAFFHHFGYILVPLLLHLFSLESTFEKPVLDTVKFKSFGHFIHTLHDTP